MRHAADLAGEAVEATQRSPRMSRRELLGAGAALTLGGGIAASLKFAAHHEGGKRAQVFIGKAGAYTHDLAGVIQAGLRQLGITAEELRGKRIALKPNLVETARGHAHINTHPAVIVAAAEVFLKLGAKEVFVAEGQGHRRDSELVLEESGMDDAIHHARLRFVDLNHDACHKTQNAGRWTKLEHLYLPKSLIGADWIVSVPKLKTHHWAGLTCSMKNLFGVMPGVVYGWPKNVLHYQGIAQSILDINATVKPNLTIVDGITGMEGDGPIMGTPKQLGCLVMGRNLPAVDATCARLMDFRPEKIEYLALASGKLGPIQEANIAQRGEIINSLRRQFHLIDAKHLSGIAKA